MLATLVPSSDGRVRGTWFDTKDQLLNYILLTFGPNCRLEGGIWFGGCNSPDEGWGRIIGFDSDDDFNSKFQQYVDDYCGHNVN